LIVKVMHIFAGRRRLLAGLSLGVASAAVLVFAIVVIVSSAVSDDLGLPSDGSLSEILEEDSPSIRFGAVAADRPEIVAVPQGPLPVRVDIRSIFIDAPVITLGVGEDTIPEVPQRPDQIAWYNFSATPGQNSNAVLSGHVDWQTSGGDPIPGVFYRLREVRIGDTILVTLENDEVLEYRVTGNVATSYDDPNVVRSMDPTVRDVITLITCGGSWEYNPAKDNGGNYSHRVVVRAERVQPAAAAVVPATN
jgi:LPXTG-site transpeptidase (sortase) family protein